MIGKMVAGNFIILGPVYMEGEGYPPLLFFLVSFTCEVGLPKEEFKPIFGTKLLGYTTWRVNFYPQR